MTPEERTFKLAALSAKMTARQIELGKYLAELDRINNRLDFLNAVRDRLVREIEVDARELERLRLGF